MGQWIIRQGAPSVEVGVDSKNVLIKSKGSVSIQPGDRLLLLNPDLVFTHQSSVTSIGRSVPNAEDSVEFQSPWLVETQGWESLKQPVEFDLFPGSLTFVHNWNQPRLHIRPGYRTLPDDDLKTIEEGEPFLAREVYITLFRALPVPMRWKYLLEHRPGPDSVQIFIQRPFFERAMSLIDFVERRVITVGRTLIQVDDRWKDLVSKFLGPAPLEAFFSNPGQEESDGFDSIPDPISGQADAFRSLLSKLEGVGEELGLVPALRKAMVSESSVQQRFEYLFRRRDNEFT
jgi:hypothetical protein